MTSSRRRDEVLGTETLSSIPYGMLSSTTGDRARTSSIRLNGEVSIRSLPLKPSNSLPVCSYLVGDWIPKSGVLYTVGMIPSL
ncbi:hypothetical protein HRI_000113900 [Hibiscus trionum]|uniref:Uncharacterized protein n=1 Tax=Hibiscus trionum TaxID=183268 RepID=A0A9W7LHK6_HIBTR|nr:hypothetical protein HRI_000113900 [Hibiscus trionum]